MKVNMPNEVFHMYQELAHAILYVKNDDIMPTLKLVSEFVAEGEMSEIDIITRISSITYHLNNVLTAADKEEYSVGGFYNNKRQAIINNKYSRQVEMDSEDVHGVREMLKLMKPLADECVEFLRYPIKKYLVLLQELQTYGEENLRKYGITVEITPKVSNWATKWLNVNKRLMSVSQNYDRLVRYFDSIPVAVPKQGG